MLSKNQILNNILEFLKIAEKAEGFFFTLSIKNGDSVLVMEQHHNFPTGSFEDSLFEIARKMNKQYPDVCLKILDKELFSSIVPLITVTKAEG